MHDDHGVYKVANTVYDGTYNEFVATIVGHEIGVRDSEDKTVEQSSETKITASFSQLHLQRLSADVVELLCNKDDDCIVYQTAAFRDSESSWKFAFCDAQAADDFELGIGAFRE